MRIDFPRGLRAFVALCLLLGLGCSSPNGEVGKGEAPPRATGVDTVAAVADALIPSSSFQDWVTFADAVVVVDAFAEDEMEPAKEVEEVGEGMIGRVVTVRLVEVLWTRSGAYRPPEQFAFKTAGWAFNAEGRRPMSFDGGARIEVGQRYLMPLVDYDAAIWTLPDDTGWGPLDWGWAYRFVDGTVRVEERQRTQELASELDGRTGPEVAHTLTETKPLPEEERIAFLQAVAREMGVAPAG